MRQRGGSHVQYASDARRGQRSVVCHFRKIDFWSVIGVTISLAQIVGGAGVMSIARTASADHSPTGAVGYDGAQGTRRPVAKTSRYERQDELHEVCLATARYAKIRRC